MNELSLEEIRKVQSCLIKNLTEFCSNNNIHLFFWAGSLLGAVRHNGPIPWDDDVDVAMLRSDYERFINHFHETQPEHMELFMNSVGNSSDKYVYPFAKVTDNTTVIFEEGVKSQGYGVFIDIFPIDFVPNNSLLRQGIIFFCRFLFFGQYLAINTNKISSPINRMLQFFFRQLGEKKVGNYITQISKWSSRRNKNKSKKLCVLTHSSLAKCVFEIDDLLPEKKHCYSEMEVSIPNRYDKILTAQYGDYMTPPPKSMQKFKHSFKAYLKQENLS